MTVPVIPCVIPTATAWSDRSSAVKRVKRIDEQWLATCRPKVRQEWGVRQHQGLRVRVGPRAASFYYYSTEFDSRGKAKALRPVHVFEGAPAAMVESAKELGFEGVVAKYQGAPYQGGRTALWQKLVLRRPEKGWRVEEPRAWRMR